MPTPAIKKRILIVDDDIQILKVFGLKLRLSGFDVVAASGGAEAVSLAKQQEPDLVLLDLLMPDMNGLDVMESLRTFSRVPIVVFTASPEKAREAVIAGATDSLTKPINPDRLVEKLRTVLAAPVAASH